MDLPMAMVATEKFLQDILDKNGKEYAAVVLHPNTYMSKTREEKKYKADVATLAKKSDWLKVSFFISLV